MKAFVPKFIPWTFENVPLSPKNSKMQFFLNLVLTQSGKKTYIRFSCHFRKMQQNLPKSFKNHDGANLIPFCIKMFREIFTQSFDVL